MSVLRTWSIAAATLAIAALSEADALNHAVGRIYPELARTLPVNDGFAQTRWAESVMAHNLKPGTPPKLVLDGHERSLVVSLVRDGYRREPLNNGALRDLALVYDSDGRAAKARPLMQASERLTKRDSATNAWLAGDYARLGRSSEALSYYDQALRTSSQAQDAVLPTMIDSLKDDRLVLPVAELLRRRPPWQNLFWGLAPRYRGSLANLAKVRLEIARSGISVDRQYDRTLIAELGSARQFAAATALVRTLTPATAARSEVVVNADFNRSPDYQPFDWELSLNTFLTTEIDPRAGVLRVSTFADGSGIVARQIVALPAQVYTLSVKAVDWDELDKNALYMRLDCAERGSGGNSRPIYFNRAEFRQGFRKPQSGCIYYALTLYATEQPQQINNIVTLDRISLVPGAPAGAAS